MKAIFFEKHGGPDVLQIGEFDDPEPKKGEVRVQIKFASINYLDIWVRKGIPAYPVNLPHVPGSDGAGMIKAIGGDGSGLKTGDRVALLPSIRDNTCDFCARDRDNQCENFEILGTKRWGTYGDQVIVPAENVLLLPDNFSLEQGAAFPLTYLTAWHMLFGKAEGKAGQSVLVTGAGSGVGMAAIQLAKMKGLKVLASTTSPEKEPEIRDAGAMDVFIQRDSRSLSTWVMEKTNRAGVNIVVDPVGSATVGEGLKSLSRYGRLVNCGNISGSDVKIDLRYLFSRDLSMMGSRMGTHREFSELATLVLIGKVKPKIDKIFSIEDAAEAHRLVESGKHTGKVLLRHSD